MFSLISLFAFAKESLSDNQELVNNYALLNGQAGTVSEYPYYGN